MPGPTSRRQVDVAEGELVLALEDEGAHVVMLRRVLLPVPRALSSRIRRALQAGAEGIRASRIATSAEAQAAIVAPAASSRRS